MKRHLLLAGIFAIAFPFLASAQFEKLKDSVIELYGVVMTADSLQGIPGVSITIKSDHRGTQTNSQGVFSIVVQKGDVVEFTSIGYKPKLAVIPRDLEGNHYSLIQLMVTDTMYLPATIIRPRPTKEQFERDFVNLPVPDDDLETARKNNDETKRRIIARNLPRDGRENSNMMLNNGARRATYYGQTPPQNIFNPFAWSEFIKAWKRGDFKNNN